MVGQRTLDPYVRVQILPSQPKKFKPGTSRIVPGFLISIRSLRGTGCWLIRFLEVHAQLALERAHVSIIPDELLEFFIEFIRIIIIVFLVVKLVHDILSGHGYHVGGFIFSIIPVAHYFLH